MDEDELDENDGLKRFKCLICGSSFTKEMELYAHITSHSPDLIKSGYVVSKTSKSRLYNCATCDFSTSTLKSVKLHLANHTSAENVYGNTNKENFSPEDYSVTARNTCNSSTLKDHNEDFDCAECEETFAEKEDLECHAKEHEPRPFQCDVCCETYKDKHGLKWHVKTRHEPDRSTHKCDVCNKVYSVNSRLQQHVATSHADDVKVECDVCGKSVSKFCLTSHKKTHVDCKFEKCDEIFASGEEVKARVKIRANYKPFECDTCKKCFSTKKHILFHLKRHVSKSATKSRPKKPKEPGEIGRKRKTKLDKPFKCDEENCTYATTQFALLKAHKFKHNPFYKCVTCQEKLPTRLDLKNHMSIHGERPYKCDQCDKSYKDKHGLGWHKKVQHDPSRLKYTCELCGKTYPFDSLLTQHINLTHATEKQSVCDICGKNVSKTYLPMHRRTHGEKQYSCDVCQKTFLEKAYLKRHKMVHTGEKPYVCSVCGNSFRQHSTLTIHMRTHTGDRPYKCILCENAYKTHHNLKKHYKRSGHKLV